MLALRQKYGYDAKRSALIGRLSGSGRQVVGGVSAGGRDGENTETPTKQRVNSTNEEKPAKTTKAPTPKSYADTVVTEEQAVV
jgi:hypothetical protein